MVMTVEDVEVQAMTDTAMRELFLFRASVFH